MTKTYSLENRLTVRAALSSFLTVLILLATIDFLVVNWLNNQFDNNLRDKLLVLATLIDFDEEGMEFDFSDEIMPEFSRSVDPEYFQITLQGGSIFKRSKSLTDKSTLHHTEDWVEGISLFDDSLVDGRSGRQIEIVYVPRMDDEHINRGFIKRSIVSLVVAKGTGSLSSFTYRIHLSLLAGSLLIGAIIFIQMKVVTRSALRSLKLLGKHFERLDSQTIGVRVKLPDAPKELIIIVDKINESLAKIEDGIHRERRFTGDVAHELRTPITELKAMAEVLIKLDGDKSDYHRLVSDTFDIAMQMELMTNNLLALARSESDKYQLYTENINVYSMIARVVDKQSSLIESKHIRVEIDSTNESLIVKSGRVELEIILVNIINNAIEYSPSNSVVDICLKLLPTGIDLVISNQAEQLNSNDLDHMFERMWRKDSARSTSGHAGIGMALVKAYSSLLGLGVALNMDNDRRLFVHLSGLRAEPL